MNLVGGVFTIDFAGPRPGSFRVATSQPAATSDAFYVGDARCALVRVAVEALLAPQPTYPLVVLHGPTGSGKTLLARGITGLLQQGTSETLPLAFSASAFARACGLALETNSLPDFRQSFDSIRALIIDDVHLLVDKPNPQEELVYALDRCCDQQIPVVLTMRHAPQQEPGLLPALASRLIGGLDVPLQAPGPDGLRELAVRVAAEQGARLPAATLDELVAWGTGAGAAPGSAGKPALAPRQPSIPQFMRVVTRITQAFVLDAADQPDAHFHRHDAGHVHKNSAEPHTVVNSQQLRHLLDQELEATQPELRTISATVAKYFDQKLEDLRGPARRRELVQARSIAMYLARLLTGKSLGQVGKHFGNRDHTTVLHAYRRIQRLIQQDDAVRKAVDDLASHFARN